MSMAHTLLERNRLAWIAVAVVTAIRIFVPRDAAALPVSIAVIAAAVLALVLSRPVQPRIAAVVLLLVGIVDMTTLWRVAEVSRSFAARSSQHAVEDARHMRVAVASIEQQLDATAQRLAAMIDGAPQLTRAQLFAILHRESGMPGRGARVLDAANEPVAWWGEELRADTARSYQFDATSLYVIRTRPLRGDAMVEAFARIPNEPAPS